MRSSLRAAFAFGVMLLSGSAWAQEGATAAPTETAPVDERPAENIPAEAAPRPAARWVLSHLDVIRLNPLGLETQNRFVWQHRLMDSDSVLFGNTFASAGLGLKLNPAFLKVGPVVEVQPIAVLHVRVAYEFMQFFGTFDYVQSYPEPTDPDGFSDDNRKKEENAERAYTTNGHHAYIEPTVQAKVGPIALRSKFAFEWWKMSLENGDRVWYDATLDTYVPGEGLVMTNDTDLLYLAGDFIGGARLSWVNPLYSDDDFVAGEPDGFDGMSHLRVGPLAVYTLSKREGEKPVAHRVLAHAAWYLDHPNREGAMPYLLVGYSYERDI
ncbi:MAG: hypothetical protein KC620_15395 [Myxococcales bacterium]|nr:hypothetical protein [Myxococcales bacterium]